MPATTIASIVSPNISVAITAVDAGTRKKSRATFAAAPWRNNPIEEADRADGKHDHRPAERDGTLLHLLPEEAAALTSYQLTANESAEGR